MDDEPFQEIYFIGIALPRDLDRQISHLKWDLFKDKDDMLKPLVPHVTLLHPPSLRGIMPSELIPKIRDVADRYLPMTIELTTVGFFGSQVCFLKAESHKLMSLQSRLVDFLPPEAKALHYRRPYAPHVTLAQKYEPKALEMEPFEKHVLRTIRLPLSFQIDSVSCFTRIKPREYASKPI